MLKEGNPSCTGQLRHQVEPVAIDAAIMGNNALRALVGLVRGLSSSERERLGFPDTLDMHERTFYEAWFDEKARYPLSQTDFYEKRLSERLDMPLEEVQEQLKIVRVVSGWLHKQFYGSDVDELSKG